jgi:GntR family transcriptional regulator / MocR family aminotransferase
MLVLGRPGEPIPGKTRSPGDHWPPHDNRADMELHIVIQGRKDLAGQVYRQLRAAIESGRLAGGEQIPPSRLLAEQLGVSRKTVSQAYARLTLDKLLVGQVGVGTFVNAPPAAPALQQTGDKLAGAAVVRHWAQLATPLRHPAPEGEARYEYIGGRASSTHFPLDEWRRCVLQALRQDAGSRGRYGETEGLPALRQAIARHAGFSRGVRCTAADVVVTNGAQQALDLVARVLVEPGCTVAVEEPGYPPARLLFASQGAQVACVAVDAEGIVVEQIPDGTRLIYVTPSHQFPLGMPMSVARRQALLARALQLGAIIIEDDYDSAFRYEGRPTDSLQSMDRHGIVAYVGTFSKVLLPEIRIGYLVAPPAILNAVLTAKYLTDCHSATMTQRALANFIDGGYLLKHIRRCHAMYASRRDKLLARFNGDLSPWFEAMPSTAGFHMTALAKRRLDLPLLLRLARRVEVALYSLDGFYHSTVPRQGLLLGYGAIETLDIDVSLDRVRQILLGIG